MRLKHALTLDDAKAMAEAARRKASHHGVEATIATVRPPPCFAKPAV